MVFLSLTDQDKQVVRNISAADLCLANGIKLVIEELDKHYLKRLKKLSLG